MDEAHVPNVEPLLRCLVSRGLTFDEYTDMLRGHWRPKLLGPLRIHLMRVLGVQTWRVAPRSLAAQPLFCLDLDRPARFVPPTADDFWAAMGGTKISAGEKARHPRWWTKGRCSRRTRHFTPRPARRPLLGSDRDEASPAEKLSIEDFRELLRQRPDFQDEALRVLSDLHVRPSTLADSSSSRVEKNTEDVPKDNRSALERAEERAALDQEPRKRTPAQRAAVAAFNQRAAAARAADKRGQN